MASRLTYSVVTKLFMRMELLHGSKHTKKTLNRTVNLHMTLAEMIVLCVRVIVVAPHGESAL